MDRLEPNNAAAPKWSPGLETVKTQAELNGAGVAASGMADAVNTLTNQVVQLGSAFELVMARLNASGSNAPKLGLSTRSALGEGSGIPGFRH